MRQILLALAALVTAGAAPAQAASPQEPTVVELFTSQGCSSCPPANAAVAAIADRPDVLALSFGVTYWDQLGWTDTFAHQAFTNRQHRYAAWLKNNQVYTPQVVVNGRVHSVGNRKALLEQLIAGNARKPGPDVRLAGDAVTIAAGAAPSGGAEVWMVRYDPRTIAVPIRRGENGGKTLPHRNVVRELVKVGTWSGSQARYALPAPTRAGLRTAVLVQASKTGAMVAAAKG